MAANLKTIVGLNPKIKPYTPILECIVNSINSIQEKGIENGEIRVKINRQTIIKTTLDGDNIEESTILGFDIMDNGIGFNDIKTNAFDEPFTDNNFVNGGMGYGRFTSLRIFNEVQIDSIYTDIEGSKKRRKILFKISNIQAENRHIITEEAISAVDGLTEEKTTIKLIGIKSEWKGKYDSMTSTIAKRLAEDLLPYLINATTNFPKIYVYDDHSQELLNDFIKDGGHIWKIDTNGNDEFLIGNPIEETLSIMLIGFYGAQKPSSDIILTAHNRTVTVTSLHKYIPEFSESFEKVSDKEDGIMNYYIKAYISGKYLDDNVNFQRESFNFSLTGGLFGTIDQEEIEKRVSAIIKTIYQDEYKLRLGCKERDIAEIINTEIPFLQSVFKKIDIAELPYKADSKKVAAILYQKKYELDTKIREDFENFFKEGFSDDEENIKKFEILMKEISESQRDSLVQYVCNRKLTINSLKELLNYIYTEKKFVTEDMVHNLIYPKNSNSETTDYDDHNLWLLDERLVFSKYVVSDKQIFSDTGQRIDLGIFGNETMFRDDNNASTPVFIYEFKRPGEQLENKDHIGVLKEYLLKVRKGEIKLDLNKRSINIEANTPIYGFLICDIGEDIEKLLDSHDFKKMPDSKGYYLRYEKVGGYIEVLTWDRVVEDAEKRHKAFFNKLGII